MSEVLDVTSPVVPGVGKATVPVTIAKPSLPTPPPSSIALAVNAGIAAKPPKGFMGGTTDDLNANFLHCLLYGEVDSQKTTTAAMFGGPSRTLIILTRAPEQLIPLQGMGFRYARVENAAALGYALQFPEKAADSIGWPEWKEMKDRVLVADDMTEGVNFIVEDNETNDEGKERKDGRQIYKGANGDLRGYMDSLKRKPMHLIMTALAKVDVSQVANEETVYPDLPKGARSILTADMEYVFFMKKSSKKMLTTSSFLSYTKKNEFGKDVPGRRDIFARNKLPRSLVGRTPPVILSEEPMDLKLLWEKIQLAKGGR